ncbi:hypothetical protein [Pilibacter termitis]|nr:hypothetical protein [Pilibacter termitis]
MEKIVKPTFFQEYFYHFCKKRIFPIFKGKHMITQITMIREIYSNVNILRSICQVPYGMFLFLSYLLLEYVERENLRNLIILSLLSILGQRFVSMKNARGVMSIEKKTGEDFFFYQAQNIKVTQVLSEKSRAFLFFSSVKMFYLLVFIAFSFRTLLECCSFLLIVAITILNNYKLSSYSLYLLPKQENNIKYNDQKKLNGYLYYVSSLSVIPLPMLWLQSMTSMVFLISCIIWIVLGNVFLFILHRRIEKALSWQRFIEETRTFSYKNLNGYEVFIFSILLFLVIYLFREKFISYVCYVFIWFYGLINILVVTKKE